MTDTPNGATPAAAEIAQPATLGLDCEVQELRQALYDINTAAVFLPGFEVRQEGGPKEFAANIIDAIRIAAQPATPEPLTDEQIEDIWAECSDPDQPDMSIHEFARAVIRAAIATQAAPKDSKDLGVTAEVVEAALLLRDWAEARNEPIGWHIAGIGRVK